MFWTTGKWSFITCATLFIMYLCRRARFFGDFVAFYCGGRLTNEGINARDLIPLKACEQNVHIGSLIWSNGLPFPISIPYPNYALHLFGLIARFEPAVAFGIWVVIGSILTGFTISILQKSTDIPPIFAYGAVVIPIAGTILAIGQITVILSAALCAAIFFLRSNRRPLAFAALIPTLIYPQLGVIAYFGFLIAVPEYILAVILLFLTMLGIEYLGSGVSGIEHYVLNELPDHAMTSIVHAWQYSLSSILFVCGTPITVLPKISGTCTIIGAVGGLLYAYRRSRIDQDPAPLLAIPPAIVLLCSYAYAEHIVALIPPLLLINRRAPWRARLAAYFASWSAWSATESTLYLIGQPIVAYLSFRPRGIKFAFRASCALLMVTLIYLSGRGIYPLPVSLPHLTFDPSLADGSEYAGIVRYIFVGGSIMFTISKIPTWLGFIMLIFA